MKFVVYTLGCKVNQYESHAIMRKIAELGYESTDKLEPADIYVLNTCAVTGEAESKSRRLISRFSRLNPRADILVCGCSSQINTEFYKSNPKIILLGGAVRKEQFIEDYIKNYLNRDKNFVETESTAPAKNDVQSGDYFSHPTDYEKHLFPLNTRTRTYIKIQDGCNKFCTYCIVPYARGRSRSRELVDVFEEIDDTESPEIIFTGINLSDYKYGIGELIKGTRRYNDKRFRLSSLEPNLITEDLMKIWLDSPVCDHFHLSMQSGSDRVLKSMNRHYTSAVFLKNIEIIRKYFPDAGITTDVIVGFPTETKSEHLESINTIKSAAFSDMHVFPYSERKGTAAYKMEQVPINIRRQRAAEISEVRDALKKTFLTERVNKKYNILIESDNSGFSSNYIKFYLPDGAEDCRTFASGETLLHNGIFAEAIIKNIYKDGVMADKR